MRKVIVVFVLLIFGSSIFAKEVIYLSSRRKEEGTVRGVTNDYVVFSTDEGVITYYPKGIIKSIYSGKQDITAEIMLMTPSENLPLRALPGVALADSLQTESSELVLIKHQLSKISDRMYLIAIPLWISVAAGAVFIITK